MSTKGRRHLAPNAFTRVQRGGDKLILLSSTCLKAERDGGKEIQEAEREEVQKQAQSVAERSRVLLLKVRGERDFSYEEAWGVWRGFERGWLRKANYGPTSQTPSLDGVMVWLGDVLWSTCAFMRLFGLGMSLGFNEVESSG